MIRTCKTCETQTTWETDEENGETTIPTQCVDCLLMGRPFTKWQRVQPLLLQSDVPDNRYTGG